MASLARYLRLVGVQARVSLALALQYRFEFVMKSVMALFWLGITLVPIWTVFHQRQTMAGWTYPEALVVIGWFVVLRAILEGGVTPSLTTVVEGIRTGMFDFILLKPADAQFLVSTARFEPWRIVDLLGGIVIIAHAFVLQGQVPTLVSIAKALVLLVVAVALLYAFWILIVSASFRVVKVDNLGYLMASIFDAGRWPVTVFPIALRIVFTVVFPIALMTTYPALALLGKLGAAGVFACCAGGVTFSVVARRFWRNALAAYTSASS